MALTFHHKWIAKVSVIASEKSVMRTDSVLSKTPNQSKLGTARTRWENIAVLCLNRIQQLAAHVSNIVARYDKAEMRKWARRQTQTFTSELET